MSTAVVDREVNTEEIRHGKSARARSEKMTAAVLVIPTIVVVTIVIIIPVLMGLRDSFYGVAGLNEDGFYSDSAPFVGLENYISIFNQNGARFWNAMFNTTFFTIVSVAIEVVLGVAMALIMHKAMRGRGFVRAAILIPWAVPTAVSAVLWKWIFDANGVANALLGHQVLWSTGEWTARWAIIIADVWKTAPYIGLLTLAGLQVIPDEVYEAAKIDGATAWQRFVRITLPLAKPALVVAVLFRTLDVMRMYDLPAILIGFRKPSVETVSMLVRDEATNLRYGSAAAYALVLFLYIFIIAYVFIKLLGADLGAGPPPASAKKGTKLRIFRRGKSRPEDSSGGRSFGSELEAVEKTPTAEASTMLEGPAE